MPKRGFALFLFFMMLGGGCTAVAPPQPQHFSVSKEQVLAQRRRLASRSHTMIGIPYFSGISGIGAVGMGGGACR